MSGFEPSGFLVSRTAFAFGGNPFRNGLSTIWAPKDSFSGFSGLTLAVRGTIGSELHGGLIGFFMPLKNLDNIDYLIQAQRNLSGPRSAESSPKGLLEEAAVAFGGPVLQQLLPTGHRTALELVDAVGVPLETLFVVLGTLENLKWVTVDKSDLKGNYVVTLTPVGRKQLESLGMR